MVFCFLCLESRSNVSFQEYSRGLLLDLVRIGFCNCTDKFYWVNVGVHYQSIRKNQRRNSISFFFSWTNIKDIGKWNYLLVSPFLTKYFRSVGLKFRKEEYCCLLCSWFCLRWGGNLFSVCIFRETLKYGTRFVVVLFDRKFLMGSKFSQIGSFPWWRFWGYSKFRSATLFVGNLKFSVLRSKLNRIRLDVSTEVSGGCCQTSCRQVEVLSV